MKTTTRNKLVLGLVAILALGLIALGALAQEEDPHYPTDLFENHVINVGQSGGFRTPEEQILTNAQGQILMSGQVPRTGTLLPGEVWTGRYVEYEQVKVTGTNEGDPSFGFVLLFDNDGAGDPVGYETYEDLDGDGDGTNWGTVYYDMDGNPLGPTAPGLSRVIRYELEVEVVEEKNILTLTEIGYEVVDPATGRSTYYDLEDQRLGYSTVAYGQTVYFNTSMTPVASLDGIGRPDYTGWISATLYAQGAPYTTEKATSLYPTVGTQILLDPNDPYVYMTAQLGEFSFEDKPEYRGHIDGDGLPGQGGYYVDESQDGVFSVAGDVNGHYVVWRIHEDQIINRESPASTTIRIWLANKPDWNVDALTPSYFYTSENTTAWFSPARGNEYYWTQSISGTPAAGIVSLNALNTNNGGGVTSAHIIDNEYQIDIPNISGGQENVAAINPTTYAINWSAAWTRGVTSTWVQGSQTVVKIIDYHIQWNKAPGSEVRPFIITIYDREADLVYQYRADTGIGNDMTIERFVRSVSAENYFPKRIVDITHHYYSSALEWGSIANGTNGIMGTEDLTNSLGQSATYDVNWGPYTIIQRMQGTLSMAIYEEPPDVGRLTLHKSLSGWWELDWDVDPETPFGVYLKNAEGHYLIFGPMITDPSDENFGTYPCIGTVGQRSFADLLYVSEEVPLRLSKIPTVGEYTDDAQRELEWYVVEEIHDSALSDWDIDLITTTLRDVDGAELAARRTLARRWQDADGNMLWVDEHNPELGTYYQSGAINVAPSLTQDAPDPAFFDHETLTEIRLVKNEELEVTIQNDFGHGVGYLQIYKSIQGFPIQHNVDEDTVFYFRIWDVAAQNYLLFDPEVRPRYQAAWDAGVKTYWCIGNHVVGFTEEHAQARPAPIMDIPVKDNEIVRVANLWTWGEYEIHEVTPKDGVVGPEAEYTDMTDLFERGWNDVWAGISDHDRDITFDISGDRSKLDFALRGARWGAGQDIDERYGIDDVAYWGAGAWMYTDWEPLWERVPWVTGGDTGGTQLAEDTPWLVHYNYGSYFVPAENPEDDPVKVSGNRRLTFNETIMIRMSNWYQMGSVDIMLTKELGGYYTDWGIKATDFFDLRLHSIHPTYFEDSLAGGYWRDVQRTLVFERIPASRTAGFEYRVVGYIEPNGLLGPEGEVLYGTTDSTLLNSKPIGSLSGIDLYAIMSEGLEDVDDDEEEEGEDDVPAVPTNGAFYYELDATVDPDRLVLTIPVSQARPQWAFDVPINGHHIYVEEVLPQGNTKILNTTITYGRAGAEIDMNLARINPAYQAALNELIASGHHLGRSYAEEDAIFFANQRESYATWWTRFDAQFRATHGGTGYRGWQSTLGSAAVATYNLTEVPTIALFSDWYANYVAWLDAGNEDSDFAFVKQQGQTYEDWWLGEPEGTGFGAKFNAAGLTPRDWYAGWLESGSDEDYPGYTPDVHNFTTLFCGHMATVAEERVKAEEAAWNVYQNALHELYIAEHHFGRQYAEEDRLFQSHRGMSYAEWWEAFNTTFQEEHEMTYPNWLSGFNTRFSSQHGMPYVSWYNVWAQAVEKAGGNPRTYDPLTCKQQGETYDDWWARVFATGILEVQDSPYADWYSAYLDGSATIDPGDVEPLFNSLYCMHMTDVAVARNGAYTKRCGLQDYLDMPLDQDQHGISIDDLGTRELTVRVYNNYTASNGAMVVTKAFPEGIGDAWFETNSFYDTWPVDRNTPFYFKIFAPPGFLVGSPDMDALFDIETWDDLTDYFSFDPEEDGYVFNNTSGEASFAGIEDGYFSFTVAGSVTNPLRLFGLPPDGAFEIVEYWKDDPLDAAFAELVGNKFAMVDEESPRGWELVQWERDEEGDLLWPLGELAYVPIEDRLTVMGKPTTPWLRYEVDFQLLTHNDEETELQNTIATVSNYFAPGEGELEVTKVIAGLEPSWLTNPTDNSQTNPMDIGARLIAAAADGRAYTAGTRNTPLPPGVAEETYFLRVLDVTKLNYLLWTDAGETKPGDNGDPSIKVYRCVGNDVDGNSELVEPGTDGVLLEIKAGETIRLENLWTNREYRVEEVLPGDPDYPGDAPAYNYTVRYYSPEDENRDSNNFLNNGERSHVIVTNTYPSYYRVTYQDLIPDTGTMPVDETWYLEDDVATILPNDLEREGYTFEGWASDIADDDTLYTTGASLTMPDDDVVLTAVWEPIDYTVTYHSGGATGDVPVDDATYHLDDAVDVTEPTGLTKAGHRFMGWRSNLTDTPLLQPGEEVFTMPAKDVNLTAEWEQEYTLTYDANGYAEGIVPTDTPPNGT
ncbi:MAG: InlB B-repeat-containing protein, partial [Oscillospiraceae bacterium]|nr:InlB B-repeat-containing protein [Oscillospiraceae bacterium]